MLRQWKHLNLLNYTTKMQRQKQNNLHSNRVLPIMVSGEADLDMVTVSRNGKMEHITKVIGNSIRPMVMANSIILMVTHIKETGLMIVHLVQGFISIRMVLNMWGLGVMICNMAKVKRYGLTRALMLVSTSRV